jgi:glycosyltransferase involved in cell wall biosynthesis
MLAHVGSPPAFVRRDLALLGARYQVAAVRIDTAGSLGAALGKLSEVDCLVCWFGSLRFLPLAAAARARGIPLAIIAGGYDLANLPEIGYGNMRPGARRVVARTLFRLADAVACVSEAAAEEAVVNGKVPRSRVRVVYNAFDSEAMGAGAVRSAKEAMVLTVAGVDATTLMRKGLLTVARTSRLMPDVPFVIAGRCTAEAGARLVAEGGPNLTVAGFVPDDALERLFSRARVYYQPSSHEAFGCSVAEAMLHDCLPVVSDRFALPEVVGPCGLYVPADDPAAAVPALRRALACDVDFPEQPRARIKRQFPSHRRGEELAAILDELMRPAGRG